MKKRIVTAFMLIGLAFGAQAQNSSKNAIGLRLGDNDGFGGEVSYQRSLSKNNRLEFDLGWRTSKYVGAAKLAGLYQWVWSIEKGFNWYAGVGGGVGSWSYNRNGINDNGVILFVAGDIGIEYNFKKAPIQLSLDLRPELYVNSYGYRDNNFGPDLGLGVRYKFD